MTAKLPKSHRRHRQHFSTLGSGGIDLLKGCSLRHGIDHLGRQVYIVCRKCDPAVEQTEDGRRRLQENQDRLDRPLAREVERADDKWDKVWLDGNVDTWYGGDQKHWLLEEYIQTYIQTFMHAWRGLCSRPRQT